MPGYEGISAWGMRVLVPSVPGYEVISSGVRGYQCRGTRVLVPGYEGISAGVRGYQCRGARVSVPGHEGISAGARGY